MRVSSTWTGRSAASRDRMCLPYRSAIRCKSFLCPARRRSRRQFGIWLHTSSNKSNCPIDYVMMVSKKAFEVVTVISIKDEHWLVQGRALEIIKIGDVMSLSAAAIESIDVQFKILSLSTYGRQTDILFPAMTGDITLVGRNEKMLREASWLFIKY